MKLELGLGTILMLHFEIQVHFCNELTHWVVIYRSPGPQNVRFSN